MKTALHCLSTFNSAAFFVDPRRARSQHPRPVLSLHGLLAPDISKASIGAILSTPQEHLDDASQSGGDSSKEGQSCWTGGSVQTLQQLLGLSTYHPSPCGVIPSIRIELLYSSNPSYSRALIILPAPHPESPAAPSPHIDRRQCCTKTRMTLRGSAERIEGQMLPPILSSGNTMAHAAIHDSAQVPPALDSRCIAELSFYAIQPQLTALSTALCINAYSDFRQTRKIGRQNTNVVELHSSTNLFLLGWLDLHPHYISARRGSRSSPPVERPRQHSQFTPLPSTRSPNPLGRSSSTHNLQRSQFTLASIARLLPTIPRAREDCKLYFDALFILPLSSVQIFSSLRCASPPAPPVLDIRATHGPNPLRPSPYPTQREPHSNRFSTGLQGNSIQFNTLPHLAYVTQVPTALRRRLRLLRPRLSRVDSSIPVHRSQATHPYSRHSRLKSHDPISRFGLGLGIDSIRSQDSDSRIQDSTQVLENRTQDAASSVRGQHISADELLVSARVHFQDSRASVLYRVLRPCKTRRSNSALRCALKPQLCTAHVQTPRHACADSTPRVARLLHSTRDGESEMPHGRDEKGVLAWAREQEQELERMRRGRQGAMRRGCGAGSEHGLGARDDAHAGSESADAAHAARETRAPLNAGEAGNADVECGGATTMCTEGVRDGDVAAIPPSRQWTAHPRPRTARPRRRATPPRRRRRATTPPRKKRGGRSESPRSSKKERRKETNQPDDAPCTPDIHPCWSPMNRAHHILLHIPK
ncbi:hypothetical protein DFH09DRAFT_1420473 [Mycena vulgaris]|nr:hypothetical protein DFH09DRAFT_1420473 [Mycena vulgaris]